MIMGERMEERLKSGKIQGGSSSQAILKNPFNRFKMKEGETCAIYPQRGWAPPRAPTPIPYFQYAYVEFSQYPTTLYRPISPASIAAQVPQYQAPQP